MDPKHQHKLIFVAHPIQEHFCRLRAVERVVMAHRYLYHVLGLPVISNEAYDALAAGARAMTPAIYRIHSPGSLFTKSEDYSEEERLEAISTVR